MNTLALDLATRTGWAHTGGHSGVADFSSANGLRHRLGAFWGWLDAFVDANQTDQIVFESAHHRGGAATRSGIGMQTVAILAGYRHDIPVRCVHTATLKKHATGSGRATKDEMLAAAIRQNPSVLFEDDNHVDAVWLLHLAHSYPDLLKEV